MQKLYASLKEDISQEGLVLASAWVIGEYGDALLRGGQYEEEELVKEIKESDVVDLFTTILNSSYASQSVKEYIVTSAVKLTTRMRDPEQIDRLRRLLLNHTTDLDVEIQQRSIEYGNLFGYDQIRRGVLERMPPPEIREEQRVLGEATSKTKKQSRLQSKKIKPSKVTEQDMLLDLMGGTDMSVSNVSSTINGSQNNADLLADILGGGSSITSAPPQTMSPTPQRPQSNVNSIMDLFDGPSNTNDLASTSSSQPQPSGLSNISTRPSADLFGDEPPTGAPPPAPEAAMGAVSTAAFHSVYNKNELQITFQVQRNPAAVQIMARFKNTSNINTLTGLSLQAAVPKSQKLQLQAISATELNGGAEATQLMRVVSVNGVSSVLSVLGVRSASMGTDDVACLATPGKVTLEVEDQLFDGPDGTDQ